MSNSNYQRGRALEYAIVALFKGAGFDAVRTAGSHSPFDFVAVREGRTNEDAVYYTVIVGQCKRRRKG